jgi:O-antigen ligase
VLYGIFLPTILSFFQHIIGGYINAIVVLSVAVILIVVAFCFGYRAIFKNKDRAVLNIIAFCALCLVGAFWLVFVGGELLSPH